MENICDYGCNQIANYKMKNGKNCCSKSLNSCPGMKLKNSIGSKKHIALLEKPRIAWNKGKKTPIEVLEKMSKSIKKLGMHPTGKCKTEAAETIRRKRISISCKGKSGGYRKGSGRGKYGWYKGYWCDSSWELAFVIYNLENNINFTRNTKKFMYIYEEKTRGYLPDFIIDNNIYIEIKGFETKKDLAKYKYFPHTLVVMYQEDLKEIFDYVENKYGKDYIKLYGTK